jgi:hypothetical protein
MKKRNQPHAQIRISGNDRDIEGLAPLFSWD